MTRLVILGAGTAGTMVANKLRRRLPLRDWQITVVDRDDVHLYQPGTMGPGEADRLAADIGGWVDPDPT